MTAPWSFQFPTVAPTQPGAFQPAPSGGDELQGGVAGLIKALAQAKELHMQQQQIDQQGQVQNRELDVRRELGLGGLGQQRAELGQRTSEDLYKRQQQAEAQARQEQAGAAFLQTLPPDLQAILSQAPAGSIPGLVEPLQKSGRVGETPTSQREFARYQELLKTDPAAAAKYYELIRKPPGTTVNVGGEKAHTSALANVAGDLYKTALTDAQSALRLMPSITGARALVDKSFTGLGANAQLNAGRLLSFFGQQSSGDKVVDTQTLKRLAQENTLAYLGTRALGSGTAVSDKDREYMQSLSGENITLEPSSLKRIFRINYGTQIMKVQDAVNELRQQAIDYPADAPQLTRRAAALESNLRSKWVEYGAMLQEEKKAEATRTSQNAAKADQYLRKLDRKQPRATP